MAARSAQKREESNARSALIWGSLAFCSILAVCSLIALKIGTTGGELVTAKINTTPPPQRVVVQKPQGASEFEVARLNDAVRALVGERDRLAARVQTLEQSVGDITASIGARKTADVPKAADESPKDIEKKPAEAAAAPEPSPAAPPPVVAATPPPPVQAPPPTRPAPPASSTPFFSVKDMPAPAAEAPAEKPAVSERTVSPRAERTRARVDPVGRVERPGFFSRTSTTQHKPRPHRPHVAKAAPPPAPTPVPPPRPEIAANNGPATQVAKIMPAPAQPHAQSEVTGATRTEFGIDLGGETSLDGLRARWSALKGNHGPTLEGLQPLVRVREGSRPGTVELHLIAGPVANAGTAARVCAKLQATGVACKASEFDGQRLSIR